MIAVNAGPAREWGEQFTVPFARESLADSRTLRSGDIAVVATLGRAGVEIAPAVLAETQGALLPLVPHRDVLRVVFVALALAGVALAIHARLGDWRRGRR